MTQVLWETYTCVGCPSFWIGPSTATALAALWRVNQLAKELPHCCSTCSVILLFKYTNTWVKHIFILWGREKSSGRGIESSHNQWFTLQVSPTDLVGNWSQELGNPPCWPVWVDGSQVFEPSLCLPRVHTVRKLTRKWSPDSNPGTLLMPWSAVCHWPVVEGWHQCPGWGLTLGQGGTKRDVPGHKAYQKRTRH